MSDTTQIAQRDPGAVTRAESDEARHRVKLTIPRREEAKPRRIDVSVG